MAKDWLKKAKNTMGSMAAVADGAISGAKEAMTKKTPYEDGRKQFMDKLIELQKDFKEDVEIPEGIMIDELFDHINKNTLEFFEK